MGGPAHAGAVAVPVQQVEGGRLLTQQIVVDDVRPDQVVGAQQVEHVGHLAAVEITPLHHLLLDEVDLVLAQEDAVSPTLEKSCIETMNVAELNRLSPCVASQAKVVISSVPPMQ